MKAGMNGMGGGMMGGGMMGGGMMGGGMMGGGMMGGKGKEHHPPDGTRTGKDCPMMAHEVPSDTVKPDALTKP
jgi:hypothetical protein